jgi:tetratricopeptide (TPR) repeat protein
MFDGTLGGRAETCVTILEALEAGWSVTVCGPPGVGKSSVAGEVEAAWRRAGKPVLTVILDEAVTAEALWTRVGVALGVSSRTTDPTTWSAVVKEALEAPSLLVRLDGPAVFASAEAVEELVGSAKESRVLCCAPRPFGWPVERAVRLEPLPLEDASRLLGHLVRQRGLELPTEALEGFAARSDGLPLVLELLAGRLAMLGLRAVEEERDGAASGARLERSIAQALRTVELDEASALLRLAQVRGAFDLPLAVKIIDGDHAARRLERLVEASLIHADPSNGTFRVLDSIRAAVIEQASSAALGQARAHHARVFAEPMPDRPQQREAFVALTARREDLLAAWRWVMPLAEQGDTGSVRSALELGRTLDGVLLTQGPTSLHLEVLSRTTALLRDDADRLGRDLLLALGRAESFRGQRARALRCFERVRRLAEAASDRNHEGWASAFSAYIERCLGRFEAGGRSAGHALAIARGLRDFPMAAMAEIAIGHLAWAQGQLDDAALAFRRVLAIADVTRGVRIDGIGAASLGSVLVDAGRLDEAREALARARRAFEAVDDRYHLARVMVDEARLAMQQHGPGSFERLLAAADRARLAGSVEGELFAREALVLLARREGDAVRADEHLRALEALVAIGDDQEWLTRVERLRPSTGPVLELSRDARFVRFGEQSIDFSRRGPLRRVLLALAEASVNARRLSSDELREAGWPGERMYPASAAARVYSAVRRLRTLGLADAIVTLDDGYGLAAGVRVVWKEHSLPGAGTANATAAPLALSAGERRRHG